MMPMDKKKPSLMIMLGAHPSDAPQSEKDLPPPTAEQEMAVQIFAQTLAAKNWTAAVRAYRALDMCCDPDEGEE